MRNSVAAINAYKQDLAGMGGVAHHHAVTLRATLGTIVSPFIKVELISVPV